MSTKKSTTQGIKRKYYPFNHEDRLLVKDNKCVLIVKYELPEEVYKKFPMIHTAHLCGYVSLPIEGIPNELCQLGYDSYLHYLNVPGGITYCEPATESLELREIAQENYEKRLNNLAELRKNDFNAYMQERIQAMKQYRKDLIDLGAKDIVYGFDTGHAGDDEVKEYQEVDSIMKLCEQMENQLKALFFYYEELEATDPEERLVKIDEIRALGEMNTNISPINYIANTGKFTKRE
jgi:hypothetical protein